MIAESLLEGAARAPAGDRRRLRKALVERRRGLSADDCARLSRQIRALLQAFLPCLSGMRVGFCWPVNNEPDLRPLIERWVSEGGPGFAALLPVVGEAAGLAFRPWAPGTVMVSDRYGIPMPAAGDFMLPEALLIPVNGFDAAGYRIGYGGGYFDRLLAALSPRPLAIGVGFELARLVSIDPEPHDQPLDVMVTEAGVFVSPSSTTAVPLTNGTLAAEAPARSG
ncbi:MAG: 5-formyltetrahydrofolate cyclo-ligase [Candidatus Accumulibacter sp. UW27]